MSGVTSKVPPRRLVASPKALTCHIDAGALGREGREIGRHHDRRDIRRAQIGAAGIGRRGAPSIAVRLCKVNGELLSVSPVPFKPTTRPYPTRLVFTNALDIHQVFDPGGCLSV